MTIIGIEGGIGAGKTLTGVNLILQDLYDGKKIYANVKFKNIPKKYLDKITYMTKDMMLKIFELIKTKEWDMKNSSVFIQEAHNYMDSRSSMTPKNKVLSYWILQSRHTGEGSCDIIYDTQELSQVDKRLRRNTDIIMHPIITTWEHSGRFKPNGKEIMLPKNIIVISYQKIRQYYKKFGVDLDVSKTRDQYDTHEVVAF